MTFTEGQIKGLISRPEGISLEFKREIDDIYDPDPEQNRANKDKLTRDIVALSNGNVGSANSISYLIIGVNNKYNPESIQPRTILGVDSKKYPSERLEKELIQIVNGRCDPQLESLPCEYINFDGKEILIISIPPTPLLHETTKDLCFKENNKVHHYSERTAFIRRGEHIKVAASQERSEIQRAKTRFFSKKKGIQPTLVGMVCGIYIGGILVTNIASRVGINKLLGLLTGIIVFGIGGSSIGYGLGSISDLITNWRDLSFYRRIIFIVLMVIILAAVIISFVNAVSG